MSETLSNRQAIFVAGILSGKTATKAAIDAGYSDKWAGRNADRLTKNKEISEAIEEGKKAIDRKGIITRERALRRLSEIIDDKESKASDVVSATAQMAKMEGWNSAEKVEISGAQIVIQRHNEAGL